MQRLIGCLMLIAVILAFNGCMTSVEWGPNIALNARATADRMNDGNEYTGAKSQAMLEDSRDMKVLEEQDKFTQVTLSWNRPVTIGRVIVKAEDLEVFMIEALIDEEWKTLRNVKENLKDQYATTFSNPINTTDIRLRIPRKYDSRRVGGAKRRDQSEGGMPSGEKNIYEFEAYAPPTPKEAQ